MSIHDQVEVARAMDAVADRKVDEFKRLGDKASYHLADDSGREWQQGHDAENAALAIFDANPELQPRMREVAKGFLWLLSQRRPEAKS